MVVPLSNNPFHFSGIPNIQTTNQLTQTLADRPPPCSPQKKILPENPFFFPKALGDLTLDVAAGVVEREVDGFRTICTGACRGWMGVNWLW